MVVHQGEPAMHELKSQLVTYSQMQSEIYAGWLKELKIDNRYHRKDWEHIYILEALKAGGMLRDGMSGVGFGVGSEPLPAVMATYGCRVLATEINIEKEHDKGWVKGADVTSHLAKLNEQQICEPEKFKSLVSYRDVDMNYLPPDLSDFDFTWSSCSLEHLGTLEHGVQFIFNSLKCIKPGGLAVHTTEYTTARNRTVTHGSTVYYRKSDIFDLAQRLAAEGHRLELNLSTGSSWRDWYLDIAPYRQKNHLKLVVSKQGKLLVGTSIGLIIRKAG